jgi:acyl-CoA reductase-like NAD-dependent aldehyde dehydrogenase
LKQHFYPKFRKLQTMGNYLNILRTANFIAGEWLQNGLGAHQVVDKYSGESLATLLLADSAQVEAAVVCAQAEKQNLQSWSAGKRAKMLEKLADLLESKRADFVDLIVREAGKPIGYARTELDRGVLTLRMAAAEATRFGGEYVPMDFGIGEGKTALTRRFPVGVVLGITPFNFPLNLVLHKVAPALAVGCPIIVKPAPQAPLTTLAFAALIEEVGYPAGALQALVCDNTHAERLVRDARIAMLSFTGSDKVGWHLKSIAGKKKLALELGGNAAVIVDETADIAKAAALTCTGAYIYAGQVCISTQRIFVVESVRNAFETALLHHLAELVTGNPQEEGVLNGPVIDKLHLQRIHQWVEEAISAGAKLLAGGRILDESHNLYAPTLLTDTTPEMKVCSEEVFGPVAILESVPDFETALSRVNEGRYGLQVGVFTNRIDRMKIAHEQLEVGGIIIGGVPGFRVDSMPYGGVKDSGLGREGVRYAMEEMTEPRLLVF